MKGDFGRFTFRPSKRSGRTWGQFNRGLASLMANALAISVSGRVLYAGTRDGGVFDYRFSG